MRFTTKTTRVKHLKNEEEKPRNILLILDKIGVKHVRKISAIHLGVMPINFHIVVTFVGTKSMKFSLPSLVHALFLSKISFYVDYVHEAKI